MPRKDKSHTELKRGLGIPVTAAQLSKNLAVTTSICPPSKSSELDQDCDLLGLEWWDHWGRFGWRVRGHQTLFRRLRQRMLLITARFKCALSRLVVLISAGQLQPYRPMIDPCG
jgi:hypothetical protein